VQIGRESSPLPAGQPRCLAVSACSYMFHSIFTPLIITCDAKKCCLDPSPVQIIELSESSRVKGFLSLTEWIYIYKKEPNIYYTPNKNRLQNIFLYTISNYVNLVL
jgi:hypothetical protein